MSDDASTRQKRDRDELEADSKVKALTATSEVAEAVTSEEEKKKPEEDDTKNNDAVEKKDSTHSANAPGAGKKIKYAMIFGYSGEKYHGLQLNAKAEEEFPSIEKQLLTACHKAGMISDINMEDPLNKTGWQRASRTDKGVHALRNIVSAKFINPPDGTEGCVARLNKLLPEDIRVYKLIPCTGSFNCYLFCTGRKYDYYLPTYALLDNQSFNSFFPPKVAPEWPTTDDIMEDDKDTERCTKSAPEGWKDRMYMYQGVPSPVLEKLLAYRLSPEVLERTRNLFKLYEGTNMFHNFTPQGSSKDASMHRYIRTVKVSDPFQFKGLEWVKIGLDGQSFMLNQIRKMIGCVVVVLASGKPDSFITESMQKHIKRGIPMAPANGLLLRALDFSRYNDGLKNAQQRSAGICAVGKPTIDLDEEHHFGPDVEDVRTMILDVISRKEKNERIVSRWMRSVRHVVRLAWDEKLIGTVEVDGTVITADLVKTGASVVDAIATANANAAAAAQSALDVIEPGQTEE